MTIYQRLQTLLGWVAAAGVVLAVVAITCGADFLARCLGYADVAAYANAEICTSHSAGLFRRNFLIAAVTLVGVGALLWRAIAFDRQTKTAESRLLSERFATAAELMIKENNENKPAIAARISGIHIMEKLAISTPKEFAEQVIKNLIAYIKVHAQLTAEPPLEKGKAPEGTRRLGEDVKAAFAVLHNILIIKTIKDGIDNAILDFSYQDFSWLNLGHSHVNLCYYKKWAQANLTSSILFRANLEGANFLNAKLKGAYLNNAILTKTNLSGSKMADARLWTADLRGAKLNNADLWEADFAGAKLSCAQLSGVELDSVLFNGANMEDANMTEAHFLFTNMEETKLYNANLRGAILDKTSLQGTDLSGAKMQGTTLTDFHGDASTCLNGVLLDGAKLSKGELRNVRMRGASLRGVMILDADLRGIDLSEVQFGDTYISATTIFNPGDLTEKIKAAMDGKVWHSGADWAQGIKQRPADAEWDLTQYKDGYAFAGILENFAKENNSEFNSINLRKQARKLLDDDKLPKETPQKWREWLAKIDPATGLLSRESASLRALSPTMVLPPKQKESP